jgi:hypothetical protein
MEHGAWGKEAKGRKGEEAIGLRAQSSELRTQGIGKRTQGAERRAQSKEKGS